MMTMVGILVGGAGVLSIAGLVTLLLGKASASLRHLVWTATMAALVAIPVFEASGFRIEVAVPAQLIEASIDVKAESESVAVVGVDPSTPRSVVREGAAGPVVTAGEDVDGRLEAGLGAQSSDRLASTGDWSIGRLVAGVWAVGFLLFLVQTALGHRAARRLTVHDVRCCSTSALQRFNSLSVELGIKRPVRLVVSSTIRVPATWGFSCSTVVLPFAYESWSQATLDRVLVHELAHVRRRDCWSHLLAELARAVHWPNPLVWLACHRQRLESERACDDQVLGRGSAASAYVEDLLAMVRALRAESKLPRAALAMADQSGAGGRVRAILDPTQARGRVGRLTLLVAGAAAISLAAATTVVTPVAVAQELSMPSPLPSLAPAVRGLVADAVVDLPATALSPQLPILSVSAHGVAQQTLAIGLADGSEEYLFGRIADVATGPDGEMVVVDGQAHSVRVFDRDGRFVRHVGAEGDGPGEYRRPLRAAITDDGVIGICHSRGVTLFEQDGDLADFAISVPGGWCRLSSASSGGMIISKERTSCDYVGFRCGWDSGWWTYLLSASGAVTDSFPTPAPRLTINLETLDAPYLPAMISRWRPDGSRIHIWSADPEIEIDHAPRDPGGGGVASQLRLDLKPVPIPPEERRVWVESLQRRIDRAPLWSGIADELMPRDMPAIPFLTVGVDGLLWIHSPMPSGSLSEEERVADTPPGNGQDGWYWYVVDVDEMTLRSFELPFPILAIQEAAGDTIWASYLSNDVPMLGRFEIRW